MLIDADTLCGLAVRKMPGARPTGCWKLVNEAGVGVPPVWWTVMGFQILAVDEGFFRS